MKSISRLSHSLAVLLFVCTSAACGRADVPITSDAAPTVEISGDAAPTTEISGDIVPTADAAVADIYPAPPTINPIYPAPDASIPDAYPAPMVWPTPTPLPIIEMSPAPAADFAFIFEFSWCNPDIVDTFNNTYTQKNLTETWATTPLTLTDTEMAAIYQKMVEVNFFAYPEQYRPQFADGSYSGNIPALLYKFTVRNAGQTKIVEWADADTSPPYNEEARRLKELGDFIIAVTQAHPEVTQLPERQVACL